MLKVADWTLRHPTWGVCLMALLGVSIGIKSDYGMIPVLAYGIWYTACFAYVLSYWRYYSEDEGPDDDPDRSESVAELIEIEELYRREMAMSEAA